MRANPPGWAIALVSAAILAVGVCGSSLAYFTTTGSGDASAKVTNISAPAISSAVAAAGGTVTLTWGAVSAPGIGAVSYYVTRDGGKPAGTCPSAGTPETVTSCVDSGLTVGTHTYEVTVKWRSWSATSSSKTASVTIGPANRFVLNAASTTPAAAAADNLTVTAKDENGSTVTTYAGAHNLTFSGALSSPSGTAPTVVNSAGTAIAFGSATALTFTNGVAAVSSLTNGVMKLYRAGPANISVSDGSISTETSLAVTVSPLAASKLVLGATSTTQVAGASNSLTVTAQDTYGNTATTYTGTHNLTYSNASASPGGNTPTVSDSFGVDVAFGSPTATSFTAGVAGVSGTANGAMKLYKTGATSPKVTDGTLPTVTIAAAVTVSAATASKLSLAAASTTPVAAAADNLTTTALDPYGNTATSYTGTHELTFSGASTSPSGAAPTVANSSGTATNFGTATALTFTSGVASVSSSKNGVMKLNRVETAKVSATDGAISTSAPIAIAVSAGAAARFGLTQITVSAGALGSPCLFTCTLTGLGNSGTVTAKVAVTDSVGNTVSALGTGHGAKVTTNGTGTISGTPLAIPSTGPAESATTFTFTSRSSGPFTEILTAAASEGTAYPSATLTANK
jgi:hypothetical protein